MRFVIHVIAFAIVGTIGVADDRGRFPVEVDTISDGDTIHARIILPWKITLGPESIRAANFDAWEISKTRRTVEISPDEIAKGKAAREYLATLIKTGKLYVTPQAGGKRDVYGRILAELWLLQADGEWLDVAKDMTFKGHVRK